MAPSAVRQMQALQAIKAAKTPLEDKIDSRLHLAMLHLRGDSRLASLTDFRFVKPEKDGRVAVDVILTSPGGMNAALAKLSSLGGVAKATTRVAQVVSARVSLEGLEGLAAMPEVRRVRQAIPRMTHAINVSQGDLTHGAQEARAFFGVNGAGVKVGVLSDGVNSLASLQASGDLPAVQVLPGQAGNGDEGSAMLEIVHDLAPGASLAFATADPTEAAFAQNILDLATAGCNIIVDDIIYLDESPFEDGPVAQAVNTVTAAGVLYFSSAGNEGNKTDLTSGTWEGDFQASAATPPALLAAAGPLHNFGDAGQSILVEAGNSQTPSLLIWAEHFDLASGSASTDYDLYDMNAALTTIFDMSMDRQNGAGGDDFPIEFIGATFSNERLVVAKFAAGTTSSAPMFNLIIFRGQLANALATSGATRGHSSAASAFSVAATPAAASFDGVTPAGPFPGLFTAANASESFSSDGPRRIILSPTGTELTPGNRTSTGGIVRQKPDITAADGVSTAAPGFNPFYGTSAAAPHAAAIAALLKSANPALTPAQVRTALVSAAIDIEAPGVDNSTGAGIVMAHAALQAGGGTPGATLTAGSAVPTQVTGDGDAFIETNEIWNLTVPLTNIGAAGATAVSAVLTSSTPGITISAGASSYPDLAISATGNNTTPFTFGVTAAVACGRPIQFTLTATYSGGASPRTFNFSIGTGSVGTPVTFSYTGPVVPIPDGTGTTGPVGGAPAVANLPVAGVTGNVFDVNFRIDGATCNANAGSTTVGIDHTFVSDLQLTLKAPNNTSILVVDTAGGGANGGNNFCQTLLDDESAGGSIETVTAANAPFTGSFKPNALLAGFDGGVANGTWQLQAQDFFSADTGNIRAFSVIITPAVCDAPLLPSTTAGTKSVSGAFQVGSNVTYTVKLTRGGSLSQTDNPGHEFTDVLPASLTLVSATSSSGTVVATVGTNTVTWDGAIGGLGGSVSITIVATIKPVAVGTTIANQGTISYDADGNGTNESSTTTDDPGVVGANDPTTFVVQPGGSGVGAYFTVTPCRVLDTRSATPIAAGATKTVAVTGGTCGLSAAATAVSINATATEGQVGGFITLYPADGLTPPTSTLNFSAGQTRANNAVVPVAADGSIKILNGSAGTIHVIIDVNGYFE